MMKKINVKVNTNTIEKVNDIFNDLGLDIDKAINMFLKSVVRKKGIPLEVIEYGASLRLLETMIEATNDDNHIVKLLIEEM